MHIFLFKYAVPLLPIETNQRPPFVKKLMISIVALQVIFLGSEYAYTPGYLAPFFNSPNGRCGWIACVIWEVIGFALLYKFCPRRKGLAITAATLVVIFNTVPLTLCPLIGPALATLITVEGPYR